VRVSLGGLQWIFACVLLPFNGGELLVVSALSWLPAKIGLFVIVLRLTREYHRWLLFHAIVWSGQ